MRGLFSCSLFLQLHALVIANTAVEQVLQYWEALKLAVYYTKISKFEPLLNRSKFFLRQGPSYHLALVDL